MQGAPLAPAGSCHRPSPYLQHRLNLLPYYCNNTRPPQFFTCLITISCISTTYWIKIQIFGSFHLLSYRHQVTKNTSTKSRGHTFLETIGFLLQTMTVIPLLLTVKITTDVFHLPLLSHLPTSADCLLYLLFVVFLPNLLPQFATSL
jgi:hypothetical protein